MNKNEIESYASLVLKTFSPNTFGDLIPADCPDLQGSLWGIEVTQAITPEDGEINKLTSKISKTGDVDCISKKHVLKKYGIVTYLNERGTLLAVSSNNGIGALIDEQKTLHSLDIKLRKLNNGLYNKLPNYGLFIYSDMYSPNDNPCNQEELLIKMQKMSEKYLLRYSNIFLLDLEGNFFIFDLIKNKIETYLEYTTNI